MGLFFSTPYDFLSRTPEMERQIKYEIPGAPYPFARPNIKLLNSFILREDRGVLLAQGSPAKAGETT
jgi:hypothetical protein